MTTAEAEFVVAHRELYTVATFLILAAVLALLTPTTAHATNRPTPDTTTVTWAMPTPVGGWTAPPTSATATWPQTLAMGDECGGWNQVDVYPSWAVAGLVADGMLTQIGYQPEDWHVVIRWWFEAQPLCVVTDPLPDPEPTPEPVPTPTPTPEPVVPVEDTTQGDDGLPGATGEQGPAGVTTTAYVPATAAPAVSWAPSYTG